MNQQDKINYKRIEEAISYLMLHFKEQPNLDKLAENLNLSPFHFQRMFSEWVGVSPKKFLQFITIGHAKEILKEKQATLFDAAHELGLSGTGRLHDLFIKIDGMTPGEFKNGGENLSIKYSFADSTFGNLLLEKAFVIWHLLIMNKMD